MIPALEIQAQLWLVGAMCGPEPRRRLIGSPSGQERSLTMISV
jgi:hypothetical protein